MFAAAIQVQDSIKFYVQVILTSKKCSRKNAVFSAVMIFPCNSVVGFYTVEIADE